MATNQGAQLQAQAAMAAAGGVPFVPALPDEAELSRLAEVTRQVQATPEYEDVGARLTRGDITLAQAMKERLALARRLEDAGAFRDPPASRDD